MPQIRLTVARQANSPRFKIGCSVKCAMYIFKSNTPNGSDETLSKSSKNSAALQKSADSVLARIQAPVVPAQIATLNEAVAPTGTVLGNMMDSVVLAGMVSSIGQPAPADYSRESANQSLALIDETVARNALNALANSNNVVVPIANLSDGSAPAAVPSAEFNLAVAPKLTPALQVVDLSDAFLLAHSSTTVIQDRANGHLSITVIDGAKDNVQIPDFVPAETVSETFINTGLGKLTIITPATSVASLSLSGNVEFTATGMEVTSGITVSGSADASNVVLYITGGASKSSGSVDRIHLGDGNNLVFDAGNGTILMDFGAGANTVVLTSIGVSGTISFAAHNSALSDVVAIAPTDFSALDHAGSIPLVTITGLNVGVNSSDQISFLGDLGNALVWAGGSAANAQVSAVQGDASNLINWINAAQTMASTAHSIAWFHFDGATYVLESVAGAHASNVGDTLVKLTGTITFSGVDGELANGVLNLLG